MTFYPYLQQSGLFPSIFVRGFKVYPVLIEALVERWRPEMYTFHFSNCKAMITLEDVTYQLGVHVNGALIVRQNNYDPTTLVYQVSGKLSPSEFIDGYWVRMTWLESEFHVMVNSTEDEVIFASRAYLLH
ncbi:protein MAINTENANCE OF MERISTEMS-like [Hibiscus syriacus]|uniref:protein MAINTENANCE OF MERISTEMS-like n=1 Tax=Hibiscus syriacus TaxID=106335 RepID=UPI001924C6FD|nr:protein MAINTENANCE OF MERISTEMS-like [Hibiscus syriacus]